MIHNPSGGHDPRLKTTVLDSLPQHQVKENRRKLRSMVEIVIFCGQQSLRYGDTENLGHWEWKDISIITTPLSDDC